MFTTEIELENHIRTLIASMIKLSSKDLVLLENKDVIDVIVCENHDNPVLYFLEIKFYHPRKFRLGFGSAKGKGLQPEILLKQPKYFEKNMRWLICRADDPSYYFFTNTQLRNYLAGGEIGEKHNNLQLKIFQENRGLSESELITHFKEWFGISN